MALSSSCLLVATPLTLLIKPQAGYQQGSLSFNFMAKVGVCTSALVLLSYGSSRYMLFCYILVHL